MQFLGFQDVGDFLTGFMSHLERAKPPPPAPPVRSTAAGAPGALRTAARLVKDEGRRQWIASITLEELVRAGAEFCRKTIKDLREESSGGDVSKASCTHAESATLKGRPPTIG